MTSEVARVRLPDGGGWLALAAAAPATLGIVLAFYSLVARFDEGAVALSVSGWHFPWAVLTWSAVLAAAAITIVCLAGRLPVAAVGSLAWSATLLGAVAVVGAVAAFIDKPGVMEMAASVVEHVDREDLLEVAAPASGWTRAVASSTASASTFCRWRRSARWSAGCCACGAPGVAVAGRAPDPGRGERSLRTPGSRVC